jgi:hypothetical protein
MMSVALSILTTQVAVHNFMLDDLIGSLKAIGLFPLFVMIPGYAAAWLLNLSEFRRRTLAFRLAFSVPLSLAICPIVTYLAGRFGSMNAVWTLYGAAATYFMAVSAGQLRQGIPRVSFIRKDMRIFVAISAAWIVIALFSLIDFQIGDRLYYPVNAYDNAVHTAFIGSISTTGIPPQNPFYLAGPPANLRYHYFWLMMCSLVERAGRGAVTPRQALIGGIFWCGIALMALVALYLRLFSAGDPARFRRRALIGILLLGITGLDIIPTLLLVGLYAKGQIPFVLPSVELWNEQVAWFVFSIFGSTHAVHSMIACFIGFLLISKAPAARGWTGILRYSLPAALALASSIGASVYVSFVFAVFLVAWLAVTVWKKWYRETAALLVAGLGCAVLIYPYLREVLDGPGAGGGAPLKLTVRAFAFAHLMPGWSAMTPGWRLILANGPMLPLNYLLEFGFFFLVGLSAFRKFRNRAGSLTRVELASVLMVAVSILICTFLRSNVIENNDLGWRGLLIAQFILLLWAVDLLEDHKPLLSERRLLTIFIVLGAAGSVYDLTLNRFFPVLADSGFIPPFYWMSPDRQLGKRTYASRYAYEWARTVTPAAGAIQFNPKVTSQDTPAMLYSDRRFVAGDIGCNIAFGGDPKLCATAVSHLLEFYSVPPRPDSQSIADICRVIPADLMIAKDTDPVWAAPGSWVWAETPIFASHYIRLFGCPARTIP